MTRRESLFERASVLALIAGCYAAACGGDVEPPSPKLLSETGLYSDIATRQLAPDARLYSPQYPLWTDSAVKTRWLLLPSGEQIDTSDMDRWQLPVGTKLFKQFERDGVLAETRLIERTGTGDSDYEMIAYVWREDGSDAVAEPEGRENVNGTPHDVPRQEECLDCHGGEPGRALGVSAMQLAWSADDLSLSDLNSEGRLSNAPEDGGYVAPGSSTTATALGYLHANCATCHNPEGAAFEDSPLDLRLYVDEGDPAESQTYQTTIGAGIESWRTADYSTIVVPGVPSESALLARMRLRDSEQMPPIGTEEADEDGIAAVDAWIRSLPPQ